MSHKKKINIKNEASTVVKDTTREKCGKFMSYTLLFLSAETIICLIIGWLFGDHEYTKISDTFVTALLQNYNYLLGTVCITPVVVYLFSKIKKELNNRFITDGQMVMYGFLGFIIALIAVISICSIVYPINESTYYGVNSKVTVSIFLIPVVILILESIVYGALVIPNLIKKKEFWKSVRKNMPMILLVMFLIWTFISCMLAPSAADDVLGDKAPSESEVLAKTLNGCYNLKDGFWAFLMYGSVMLGAMLIGKDKLKEKKLIMKCLVGVVTVISFFTIFLSLQADKLYQQIEPGLREYSGDAYTYVNGLDRYTIYMNYAVAKTNTQYGGTFLFVQRALFRNSNHFAYVLSITIIVACIFAIIEKKFYKKVLYFISFTIMSYMLIVNDTFGAYLGVLVSLVCVVIYVIVNIIRYALSVKKMAGEDAKEQRKDNISTLITVLILALIFVFLSCTIRCAYNGSVMATSNLNGFVNDIGKFGGYMVKEENATEADVTTLDNSIRKAGSGRGETWLKVWELIKQRPMFGYGLECLLFQFNGQFGINEGRTHNLLLQLLATVGIPGTIMYFTALAIIFIRLLKNWKTWDDVEKICVFVGISYVVTALTGNSTYYTSPYFMMILGFVALTPWKRENETKE